MSLAFLFHVYAWNLWLVYFDKDKYDKTGQLDISKWTTLPTIFLVSLLTIIATSAISLAPMG